MAGTRLNATIADIGARKGGGTIFQVGGIDLSGDRRDHFMRRRGLVGGGSTPCFFLDLPMGAHVASSLCFDISGSVIGADLIAELPDRSS